MRGLLEKDLRLLGKRKQSLLCLLGVAAILNFTTDRTFVVGYLAMLMTIFSTSTISYDEYDNGYLFLMTLPIDAKIYVREKYALSLGTGLLTWILSVIMYFAAGAIQHIPSVFAEDMQLLICYLPLLIFMIALMIPFPLRFGAEKGRIAMMIFIGIVAGIFFACAKANEKLEIVDDGFATTIDSLPDVAVASVLIIAVFGILTISYFLSIRIMNKKEY